MGPYYLTALVSLLGPVEAVTAMSSRSSDARYLPTTGQTVPVEIDTHVSGVLRFASGAVVSATFSFDVWDSVRPRLELYGTEGTLLMAEPDPNSGPNIFGGEIWLRRKEDFRWGQMPRPAGVESLPFEKIPNTRPFSETGHDRNSRGIGLVDQALAIQEGRMARADAQMGLHVLEVLESLVEAAKQEKWLHMTTTCVRPAILPKDFPQK